MDLRSHGHQDDNNGNKGYLMNAMCDITQFVVSSLTVDISVASLAQLFVANIILSFGMCSAVVIDDVSTFKGAFISICIVLDIRQWCLARGNYRGNSVERYHRFLNKNSGNRQ